ncbi:MAG TPA: ABC transporter permease [Thermomicrobiaceae bacterium]|nr:ABC transporter permease [Thermomicrobiaceae bacterium]
MLRYVIRRLLQGLIVVFLISLATFGILHLTPGDPIYILIGESGRVNLTTAQINQIRHYWGLDQPLYVQYLTWAGHMFQGNFGESVVETGVPVSKLIVQAAPVTAKLNALALLLAIVVAIPAGILASVKQYSVFDYFSTLGSTLGVSVPSFWIALMLIILFALKLGWLPPFGVSNWKGYILPVIVLAAEQTAIIARVMRGTMIETLGQDFVRTARAKGLREGLVLVRHVVRNALLPVVTVIGYRLAFLLSGTIVIETVFAVPGIGQLFVNSVYNLDYQVVQAIVLILTVLVVLANLATDLLYAFIDPRIRLT